MGAGGDFGGGDFCRFEQARMVLISLGVSFGARPPVRPRARAAVSAGEGSFPDEVALELGKGGEDVEDGRPGG